MHIKTLLRAFKVTGKRDIILKIPSYFDFFIVYNFIEVMSLVFADVGLVRSTRFVVIVLSH